MLGGLPAEHGWKEVSLTPQDSELLQVGMERFESGTGKKLDTFSRDAWQGGFFSALTVAGEFYKGLEAHEAVPVMQTAGVDDLILYLGVNLGRMKELGYETEGILRAAEVSLARGPSNRSEKYRIHYELDGKGNYRVVITGPVPKK